jgi:ribosomal protein S12
MKNSNLFSQRGKTGSAASGGTMSKYKIVTRMNTINLSHPNSTMKKNIWQNLWNLVNLGSANAAL